MYYFIVNKIALATPDKEVAIHAKKSGWRRVTKSAYEQQVRSNTACSGLAGTQAKKRTGSKPANR